MSTLGLMRPFGPRNFQKSHPLLATFRLLRETRRRPGWNRTGYSAKTNLKTESNPNHRFKCLTRSQENFTVPESKTTWEDDRMVLLFDQCRETDERLCLYKRRTALIRLSVQIMYLHKPYPTNSFENDYASQVNWVVIVGDALCPSTRPIR